jgi:hypothetical protein
MPMRHPDHEYSVSHMPVRRLLSFEGMHNLEIHPLATVCTNLAVACALLITVHQPRILLSIASLRNYLSCTQDAQDLTVSSPLPGL